MMKKYNLLILALFVIFSMNIKAQVGIGTNAPNASASLEIDVTSLSNTNKKGVLLPRVNLVHNKDIVTISNPAEGLVVYNLQDSNNAGDLTTAVTKDTFYFWDGKKWVDITTIDVVKRELLPQVYFIAGNQDQYVSAVNATTPTIVDFQTQTSFTPPRVSTVYLNSGNNISLNTNNTFTVNKTGSYEVSGSIVQNPNTNSNGTNIEFIIQSSTDGSTWTDIAKNTAVWGEGTGGNAKTIIISPIVITLVQNELIRCVIYSTFGTHGTDSRIYPATGLSYSRSLKLQYLN